LDKKNGYAEGGMGEILWRTFEDIPHLAEGLILATRKNLNSCLKIANLIIDKDKRVLLLFA
jgi:hypothetical protein